MGLITIAYNFNPRSPHGERREATSKYRIQWAFQSTLPARGATSSLIYTAVASLISIHAPRTGSDEQRKAVDMDGDISIHAPRTGSDHHILSRETRPDLISIHAPRTGSDQLPLFLLAARRVFQSTLPARGATRLACRRFLDELISIHAPRTGSDTAPATASGWTAYFNPRSPHGERRLPPPSCRASRRISIHAPRTGSDVAADVCRALEVKFQSTLPARGATS